MSKSVFTETFELLNSIGVVQTQNEFCVDWLNKSESYFRCLRFHKRQPSTNLSQNLDDVIFTASKSK